MSLRSELAALRAAPLPTVSRWQDQRWPWLTMAGLSLFMVLLAHGVFQHWLYMKPCEQCVYIRFAFFCMVFGGLVAAINPRQVVLKLVGYGFGFWGIVQGLGYSLKLDRIHTAAHGDNPFGVQGCSAEPTFPLGLPLDTWAPDWFKPTGDCGFDNPIVPDGVQLSGLQKWLVDFYADGWYLVPSQHFGTMAENTLITFGVCLVLLAIAALAWIYTSVRPNAAALNH